MGKRALQVGLWLMRQIVCASVLLVAFSCSTFAQREAAQVTTKLEHAGVKDLREDLLELINGLDRDQELQWGRIFSLPPGKRAEELASVGRKHGCSQTVEGDVVVWLNDNSGVEAAFFFIVDPTDPKEFLEIYRATEAADLPLAFLVVPEPLNAGTFHVFRSSRKSCMSHSWRVGTKGDVATPPVNKRIRKDMFELFRIHAGRPVMALSKEESRAWADALRSSRGAVVDKLERTASQFGCKQKIDEDFIVWSGDEGQPEAVFFIAEDPADRNAFIRIYERIVTHGLPLTYVFVQQRQDVWDTFRLSAQWYLRHCSRPSWGPDRR